ncbi:RagB/SusD family nutrient uptake outer membrane protein [Mucilaginibacter sp. BJC16-A38]|uniref:RagB/SusD family nutrient uptake outer membrane protein n=1 Tax=Mucilaginibacter phenanthrenivorans TaxID=1234842 RepID=UPI002156FD58|nr:RagB/SusD family nutrient uptake outer membrane protein [Mucilaginibacter phenanthrenivorans]MCR8556463.1 RagB/SusD family nutrient uptake outer membrane protein [Mucilaginibacter phenanthrenivorans]
MKFNIKKYGIGVTLLVLLVTVSSCKKYLDEKSNSNFVKNNYFKTASQAQTFVNGIYSQLHLFQNGDAYGESPFITLELFAGHATSLGQSVNNSNVIHQRTDAVNPGFEDVWQNSYNAIANANLALQQIPTIGMDATLSKKLLGEVYFLRAFFYYHLVRLYGDVPLITTPVTIDSPDLYPTRTDYKKVYDQIISDLQAAETSGLPETDQTGRVSLGAVHTLLASVYLTTAGYPMQATANYALAAAEAQKVLTDYTLFTDYAYLHDNAHKNQGELIFQGQYLVGVATNALTQLTVPFNLNVGAYGDHLGAMIPTDQFVASYEAGDLRTQERQFYFSSYPSHDDPTKIIQFGEHCLYKFFHVESANGNGICDENWTFLRLPEAMLTYAEATNEVSGPTADAVAQVNKIRARAQLAPLGTLSKDAFRQEIWKERYHELAYEDKAYFDIQRTHMIYDVVNNKFGDALSTANEQGVTMKEQYLLWPIPQREINTNKKLTQNKDW